MLSKQCNKAPKKASQLLIRLCLWYSGSQVEQFQWLHLVTKVHLQDLNLSNWDMNYTNLRIIFSTGHCGTSFFFFQNAFERVSQVWDTITEKCWTNYIGFSVVCKKIEPSRSIFFVVFYYIIRFFHFRFEIFSDYPIFIKLAQLSTINISLKSILIETDTMLFSSENS